MNKPLSSWRVQRGAAAVELALLLPIFVVVLTFPLLLGRCLWHYTAAQKAAHDAARYLSSIPAQEMREPALAITAADIASEIATLELAHLSPGDDNQVTVLVACGGLPCRGVRTSALPETVTVSVSINLYDPVFGMIVGRYGLPIGAHYETRYLGR